MSDVPLASPVVWTNRRVFFLQRARFRSEDGSDCLFHQRNFR
jgi:hypothetical protein